SSDLPYVTFHNDDDDDDDEDMADSGSTKGILEWKLVLSLDPSHDSLDDPSTIGKASESPYCHPPPPPAATEKKISGLRATVTRASKAKSDSASSSSSPPSVSSPAPAYFAFKFNFPPNYPFKPPTITVLSTTYHPNINTKTGEICDAVLTGEEWGPTLNVRKVCARLRKFLCEPDPDHPLESEIAQELVEKSEVFQKKAWDGAREFLTREWAMKVMVKGSK
ncbi:hypothetical protein ACHAXS_003086, partial [Conticribra weissflogii]